MLPLIAARTSAVEQCGRAALHLAVALLDGYGLHIDVSAPLGSYSIAIQHVVAIARAVDLSAEVLILDEPTAGLDRHEAAMLKEVVAELTLENRLLKKSVTADGEDGA